MFQPFSAHFVFRVPLSLKVCLRKQSAIDVYICVVVGGATMRATKQP